MTGNASWTYSCEYFKYPTIPSLTGIWRELLEPGVAPTIPDDWPSAQAKSLTRVSIYTSTQSVQLCGFRLLQVPTVCIYALVWLMYYALRHSNTLSVVKVSWFMRPSVHRVLVRLYFCTACTCLGSCTQKIQMFCFAHVFICKCLKRLPTKTHCLLLIQKPDPKTLMKTGVCVSLTIKCYWETASAQFS